MNTKFIWISIIGIIISFAGGFLIANALNSNEISKLQAQNASLQKGQSNSNDVQNELNLSETEVQKKIDQANENPKDFAYQKGLGLALYRYAAIKKDKKLLSQVTTLLERANELNPDDYLVLVSLANLYYDLGQINKDSESNLKARMLYQKALEKNEKDTNVLTDHGLTYLLSESPEREKAVKEFEKALLIDQKNEKALVYMTQAQVDLKNLEEANNYLSKLKEVNPNNKRISELEGKITEQNK